MNLTTLLVLLTGLISYLAMQDHGLFSKLAHYPYRERRQAEWYRLVTSGFVHAGWFHLLLNMYVFWSFGSIVEQYFQNMFGGLKGNVLFMLLYLSTIVAGSIPSYFKHKDNPSYRAVGASGAVSGVLLINALFNPWHMWLIYFIPVPAIIGALGFLFYEQWASKNSKDNIGHDAHFYGAIYGVVFTLILKPDLIGLFIHRLFNNSPF